MLTKLPTLGVVEFRRVSIISIIYAVVGMILLSLEQHEAVIFLEACFLVPLVISPFIGSFGKTLTAVVTAVLGTLWGATTLVILGQSVNGAALAISLALCSMINIFVISEYGKHRKKNTVTDAITKSFKDHFAPVYGGYVTIILAFSISAFTGQMWLLALSAILLHNMIATTLTLPASINLYEHYMAKRAITKFESNVLKMINKFGSESHNVPILASWLGAGVEEVVHAIENLRAKHYVVSNRFFYPSNTLMWFVGILAPIVGYSMATATLPGVIEALAILSSSTLIVFGLSVQRSWWLNERDRLVTHLMGFSALSLGVFLSLAVSTEFALLMLLCSLLGIVVCYLPEKRFHTARVGTSIFYVLQFMTGWFANMILGVSGLVYAVLLFGAVFTDMYLVKEEKYVRI
jgi:hypothetical protein